MTFLDRVQTQARETQYKQLVVSVLLLVAEVLLRAGPYTFAWLAGKFFVMGKYIFATMKLGWRDALGEDSDKAGRPWAS